MLAGARGRDMVRERLVLPLQLEHRSRYAQPAGEPRRWRRDVLFTRTDTPSVRRFRIDHVANVCVMPDGERHFPVRTGGPWHCERQVQRLELAGGIVARAARPEIRN